jgi:hypothetical protein
MSEPGYSDLERFAGFPLDFSPNEFFLDYIKSPLPPIYFDTAQNLSHKYRVDFLGAWAWESSNLMKKLSVEEKLGEYAGYLGRRSEPMVMGASLRLSEVYRSAFIRTLAWFHTIGRIPDEAYFGQTLRNCPIDLSMWEIGTNPPPKWWPTLSRPVASGQTEDEAIQLLGWQELRDLTVLETEGLESLNSRLLSAEGTCLWSDDVPPEGLSVHFAMVAFAYHCKGPEMPSANEVARSVLWESCWYPYPKGAGVLSIFDPGSERVLIPGEPEWDFADLRVVPLAARIHSLARNTWQWFRGYHIPWSLSDFFGDVPGSLDHDDRSWFHSVDGKRVAVGQDWRLGPLERDDDSTYPLHGQVLEVDWDWLANLVEGAGLRLAHLLQVKARVRKYSYDRAKEYSQTDFINLGRIVT